MRILLIEDDDRVAEVEMNLLVGHNVTRAKDLHDAINADITLELKEGVKFELVVLDLKLPKRSEPGAFHDPEEVLRVVNIRFVGVAVVVISAFLDQDKRHLIESYNMTCIDKNLLKEAQAFLNIFFHLAEASGKMRATTFAEHMSTKAFEQSIDKCDDSEMDRMKAKLYLMAGATVILLPWLMIGFTMYAKAFLKDAVPIPYYTETLMFCGIGIAAIIGILPWILQFMGKSGK